MITRSAWSGLRVEALHRFTVSHDAAGLKELVRRLLKAGH
jgi:hypothetical protein